jgi:hypothetical protein
MTTYFTPFSIALTEKFSVNYSAIDKNEDNFSPEYRGSMFL